MDVQAERGAELRGRGREREREGEIERTATFGRESNLHQILTNF